MYEKANEKLTKYEEMDVDGEMVEHKLWLK